MITTDIYVWSRFKAIAEQALQHGKADVVGFGRMGMIENQVFKYDTNYHLYRQRETNDQVKIDACNTLRNELVDLTKSIYGERIDQFPEAVSRCLRELGMADNGTIDELRAGKIVGTKRLIDRSVVAKWVCAVKQTVQNAQVGEFKDAQDQNADEIQTLKNTIANYRGVSASYAKDVTFSDVVSASNKKDMSACRDQGLKTDVSYYANLVNTLKNQRPGDAHWSRFLLEVDRYFPYDSKYSPDENAKIARETAVDRFRLFCVRNDIKGDDSPSRFCQLDSIDPALKSHDDKDPFTVGQFLPQNKNTCYIISVLNALLATEKGTAYLNALFKGGIFRYWDSDNEIWRGVRIDGLVENDLKNPKDPNDKTKFSVVEAIVQKVYARIQGGSLGDSGYAGYVLKLLGLREDYIFQTNFKSNTVAGMTGCFHEAGHFFSIVGTYKDPTGKCELVLVDSYNGTFRKKPLTDNMFSNGVFCIGNYTYPSFKIPESDKFPKDPVMDDVVTALCDLNAVKDGRVEDWEKDADMVLSAYQTDLEEGKKLKENIRVKVMDNKMYNLALDNLYSATKNAINSLHDLRILNQAVESLVGKCQRGMITEKKAVVKQACRSVVKCRKLLMYHINKTLKTDNGKVKIPPVVNMDLIANETALQLLKKGLTNSIMMILKNERSNLKRLPKGAVDNYEETVGTWCHSIEKKIFNAIKSHLESLREQFEIDFKEENVYAICHYLIPDSWVL